MILAVAGGAFAQGLTFSGQVQAGGQAVINPRGNGDAVPVFYMNTPDDVGYRINLGLTAVNADGTVGFVGRLRYNNTGMEGSGENGHVYFRLLEKKVTIYAGRMDDGGLNGGFSSGGGLNSNEGMHNANLRVDVAPLDGLLLGFGIRPNEFTNWTDVFFGRGAGKGLPLENLNYIFGATYTIPNTVKIAASFRSYTKGIVTATGATGTDGLANVSIGVDYLGLRSMGFTKIALDAQIVDLADKLKDSTNKYSGMAFHLGQQVTYSNDLINAGIRAVEYGLNLPDIGLRAVAWLDYKGLENGILPMLEIAYKTGGDPNWGNIRRGFDFVNGGVIENAADAKKAAFGIRPAVRFDIDGSSRHITAGYAGWFDLSKNNPGDPEHSIFVAFVANF